MDYIQDVLNTSEQSHTIVVLEAGDLTAMQQVFLRGVTLGFASVLKT